MANRHHLIAGHLHPRNRDPFTGADHGKDPAAYLQHDVHADATVVFMCEHLESQMLKPLPRAGIQLTVYSRFDSAAIPPSSIQICVQPGVVEVDDPGSAHWFMYNSTGAGFAGVHYDPVFVRPPVGNVHSGEPADAGAAVAFSQQALYLTGTVGSRLFVTAGNAAF